MVAVTEISGVKLPNICDKKFTLEVWIPPFIHKKTSK